MTEAFCQLLRDAHSLNYFRGAVWQASANIHLFRYLQTSRRITALASLLDLPSLHRLQALLDVMVHEGWIERRGASYQASTSGPPCPVNNKTTGVWGALARVIQSDVPKDPFADASAQGGGEGFVRYQDQMRHWGRPAADEMMKTLVWPSGSSLLDVGGGLGTYSEAYLEADRRARATVLDLPATVAVGQPRRSPCVDRLSWLEGSAFDIDLPDEHFDIILLSNVIHWYGPDDVRQLLARALRWTAPGGLLWIKDMKLADDRQGPATSLWFALNMALVSQEGRLYTSPQLQTWMREAGWSPSGTTALVSSSDCLVWSATKT